MTKHFPGVGKRAEQSVASAYPGGADNLYELPLITPFDQETSGEVTTRILLVDDEKDILQRYSQTLSDRPESGSDPDLDSLESELFDAETPPPEERTLFDIVTHTQGVDAVEEVARSVKQGKRFSAAYVDIKMPPGLDGIETAKQMRRLDSQINIVLVSGFSEIEPEAFTRMIPPAEKLFYLQKPLHAHEIQQFSLALSAKWRAEQKINLIQRKLVSTIADRTAELADSRKRYQTLYRRYRTLYHENPSMFFTIDSLGNIVSVNDYGASVLGYQYSELIGRSFSAIHREVFETKVEELINQAISEPRHVHRQEVELIRADQSYIWVRESARLVGHAPDSSNLLVVCEDISDRMIKENEADELSRENRFLMQKSMAIQEEERKNLAREIHDELGQSLTAIQADAEFVRKWANDHDAPVEQSAETILDITRKIYHTAHSIMERLRPTALDGFGLGDAIRDMVDNWRFRYPDVSWQLEIDEPLPKISEEMEINMYRIVQEGLTNISRHSAATQVQIKIGKCDDQNRYPCMGIQVIDNGKGFDTRKKRSGLGLIGIRERIHSLNGEFKLVSEPGKGVDISIRVPLRFK